MKISADFNLDEFDCHDGTPVPPDRFPDLTRLVRGVLQPIRREWAAPLLIVSGYRTPEWNRRVGGAAGSTHLTCEGVDIKPVHVRDVQRLHELVSQEHRMGKLTALGGLGQYPRWVHVDTRRLVGGRLRRWQGKGMGSEPES